ncbi:MAG: UvrD-helicase domain-containing protein [Clostridia bacterium]|nr:UvrD-helicase domain-containing protein [Clostridia bacterium]
MEKHSNTVQNEFLSLKKSLFDKLYDNLNTEQRQAVFSVNGPLLVLAGAGTGKTTVLVNRIAHIVRFGNAYLSDTVPSDMTESRLNELKGALLLSKEELTDVLSEFITEPCPPWAMLCITFTNKAANEMKSRLALTLGEEYASEIWAGTFHSICVRLLRKYGESVGYPSNFTIYDADDAKRLVVTCMKELNIDDKAIAPKAVLHQISTLKDNLKTPAMFASEIGSDFRLNQIAAIYTLYQKKLHDACALDFDDIIMQTVRLLTENDDARSYCQNRFKYVSVDEFQDTNFAQLKLVELLSGRYRNLMVVGDDDQSIYKFRGATIENILKFDTTFPDTKIVRLEENYRSTSNILDSANHVIANNSARHEKSLRTEKGEGEKVTVKKCENQNDESKYIINRIMDMVIREKRKYSDFAVLYRTNAQSQNLEQFFVRSGVPHKVVGGQRFFERKEIKDVMSYLAVINNTADNLRIKRIINEPKRKIGDKTVSDIEYLASLHGESMYDVMADASRYPQICRNASKLKEFVSIIEDLKAVAESETLSVLFEKTLERTGYRAMLLAGGEEEADRLNNVQELVSSAVDYEKEKGELATLRNYLEEVALISDIDDYDDENNSVTLMTIHSAKGLEFPIVFIPGLEEGIFPSTQTLDFESEIEEERRLAYVAITRAKEKLYCIHTRERLMYGRTQYNPPSRFIKELPEKCVNFEDLSLGISRETARPRQRTHSISKEFYTRPAVSTKSAPSFNKFSIGERVSHPAFGEGTVLSVLDLAADVMYEVAFDNSGTKKLMATYAKLKKI